MKRLLPLLLCAVMTTTAFAKPGPTHTAKVISQTLESRSGGAAVVPMNGMLLGVPINNGVNTVVIETVHSRVTLQEQGNRPLVVPVNGTVDYYHDDNWVVILDSKHKKHKFGVVHIEELVP